MLSTNCSQKTPKSYLCSSCDFSCCKKSEWSRHILTRKHKNQQKSTENQQIAPREDKLLYECICGKMYKERTGLWRHKKKCFLENKNMDQDFLNALENNDSQLTDKDIIVMLLKQNNEFKELLVEQNKSILDISTKQNSVVNTINNNSNNCNNKTFNLQVFLNETCKDAMNIMDFVDSLQIQLSDLENVGKNGFVAGISDIILKNLRALDITQRPIHCSDQKREVIYIKDDNQWHKEHPENAKLKKAIKYIAHKNTCLIKEWKAKYPDCGQAASRKSDLYNKIVYEAMSLDNSNAEKIIKRIAKEIGIEK
jgi:hypothetical protein